MKERTTDVMRLVGYEMADPWLARLVEAHLARASNGDDEQLDYESIVLQAVPVALETLGYPCEDELPTTEGVVALHLVGMFHSPLWGPVVGGTIDGRSYAFDLNEPAATVLSATYDDDGPRSLERFVALPDGRPDSLTRIARQWMSVQQLEVEDPARHAAAVQDFVDAHPGVARSQKLAERSRVPSIRVPAAPPMSAALESAFDGALLLAPLLIEHAGLPPRGHAPDVGARAFSKVGVIESGPHRECGLRVRAIASWFGGVASDAVSELASAATQPISVRWLERLRRTS
jgi:hypothetical protein